MKNLTYSVLASFVVAWFSVGLIAQEPTTADKPAPAVVNIKVKVAKGDVLRFKRGSTFELETMMGPMEQTVHSEIEMTVGEVAEDGSFPATAKVHRVHGKLSMMGQNNEFDSAKKEDKKDETGAGAMAGMGMDLGGAVRGITATVGKTFTIHFSADGAITKIVDFPEALNPVSGMLARMSGGKSEAAAYWQRVFPTFPKAGAAKDSVWEEETKIEQMGMKGNVKSKYIVGEVTAKYLDAKMTSDVAFEGDAQNQMGSVEIEEATLAGDFRFSRHDGLPLKSSFKQRFLIYTESEMMGEMEVTMSSTETIERVEQFEKIEAAAPETGEKAKGEDKAN